MNIKMRYILIFIVSLMLLTGCGGSKSSGESNNTTPSIKQDSNGTTPNVEQDSNGTLPNAEQNSSVDENDSISIVENNLTKTKGYLIDSPLQGVTYVCDDNEGLTDASGLFECANPPITFKIGGLTLGTLTKFTADGKVYPQDLLGLARTNFTDSRLKLLARLLQSLDDDGDIDTKITITESVRSGITTTQEFKDMSQSDVQSLLSGLGKSLVEECGALEHLGANVTCNNEGSYYVYTPPVSTPIPSPTSKIKLLSPQSKSTVEYNYVTLEVDGGSNQTQTKSANKNKFSKAYSIENIKAKVNGAEYVGVKNSSSFFIYNVALEKGKNTIELIANNGSEKRTIELNSEGKGFAPIGINADKREGFEKLDTTLTIQTKLSVSKYLLDKDNDGVIDDDKTNNSFTLKYTKEGRYFPTATVKTSDGIWYSTQQNISLDVRAKPTEVKIDAITEQINDLERFGGYIWALSNSNIYKIDENNESKITTINLSGVSSPQGFTIDNNGDILIADTGNNKIIKLSKSSNFSTKILEFGIVGNANGELQEPKDITVSGIGQKQEIYILDSGNNRVQIFNSSGAYLNKIDNVNSGLSFNNTQNIIGSSTITLFDSNKIQEVGLTVSNAISKFTITDKFSDISKIGESTNGVVFFDKSKKQIVFLYPSGKIAKIIDTTETLNMLVAFNDNSTVYGILESGGVKKIDIPLDPEGAKPIDIAKKFVDSFLNDDNSTMSSLMHGSNKYKKLYEKEAIAKAVFGAIESYSEKIDKDFATVTASYKIKDEEGEIKFNLLRSAGQMKATNDWFITEIY